MPTTSIPLPFSLPHPIIRPLWIFLLPLPRLQSPRQFQHPHQRRRLRHRPRKWLLMASRPNARSNSKRSWKLNPARDAKPRRMRHTPRTKPAASKSCNQNRLRRRRRSPNPSAGLFSMKRRIKLWLIRFQSWRRVRRLLRQYRTQRQVDSLKLFPLRLLLGRQLSSLEDTKAEGRGWTGSSQALPRLLRLTGRKTGSVWSFSAPLTSSLSRLPCRRPFPAWRVRLRRRLVVWGLCQGLKLLRLCLGMARCSSRSSISSCRQSKR